MACTVLLKLKPDRILNQVPRRKSIESTISKQVGILPRSKTGLCFGTHKVYVTHM